MAENVIGIDIVARLDQFRAEMEKLPDITSAQAKAMSAQLSKEIKAAEAAAKRAAAAGKDARGAFDRMGEASGKAGSGAAKLAGALDMVAPGAGGAARGVADLADVAEVAAEAFGTLGPVALAGAAAVAVGGAAFLEYEANAERARKKLEAIQTDADQAAEAVRKLRDTTLELAVANGTLSETNAKIIQGTLDASDAYVTSIEDNRKALDQLYADQTRLTSQIDELSAAQDDNFDASNRAATGHANSAARLNALRAELRATNEEIARNEEAIRGQAGAFLAQDDATTKLTLQLRENAEAEERAKAAADAREKAAAEAARAAAARQAMFVTDAEQQAWYNQFLLDLAKEKEDAEKAEAEAAKKAAKDRADAEKRAAEEAEKELEQIGQATDQLAGYVTDAVGAMQSGFESAYSAAARNITLLNDQLAAGEDYYTDAQKEALKERIEAQEDAARAAFEAQKIAAMSTAAINTALAVSQSLASAPWPYNIGPAGFAFAAGVAEEAVIASETPAFHSGGLQPDESTVRMQPGEFMVSKQGVSAAGGREAFDRANAGVSGALGGRGDVYAITAYRHTAQVARYEADRLSRNSPTMQEISKGRTPGLRGL